MTHPARPWQEVGEGEATLYCRMARGTLGWSMGRSGAVPKRPFVQCQTTAPPTKRHELLQYIDL